MVGAKRCPMGSGGHNANVGRVKSWRPDDWPSGGRLAPPQLTAHAREPTRDSQPAAPRSEPLGRPYGASWRESPEILFALRRTADRLVFDAINPACEKRLGLRNADVAGRS